MKKYTFVDALPVRGSEAQLVTAAIAIAAEDPQRLSELARAAGISKFAASRAAEGLVTAGLLNSDPDGYGYTFNDAHPLAPVLVDLAWRFSGVRRPDPSNGWFTPVAPSVDMDEFRYRQWMPESLSLAQDLDGGGPGPSLQVVRETLTWIGQAQSRLHAYERVGQDVYGWWSTQRLRDIIHLTLHFGEALFTVRELLTTAADQHAQGPLSPDQVHVPGLVWARATYLVSAELRDLLRVIQILDTAIRVGGAVNHRRGAALAKLHQVNVAGRSSELADEWIQEALEEEARSGELWMDESYGPFKHLGGLPSVEDVGTAGDKILAASMYRDATVLAERVQSMAQHPSVEQWRAENLEQAKMVPLIYEVPADVLHGSWALVRMPTPKPGAGPYSRGGR